MKRKILAVVSGVVAAFALVMILEAVGHAVYPPPPELDVQDPAQLQDYMAIIPVGALLFVLAAWSIATLGGAWLAGFIAREKQLLFASIVGLLVLIGSIANMVMIPHPAWFVVAAVVVIPVMSFLGSRLA